MKKRSGSVIAPLGLFITINLLVGCVRPVVYTPPVISGLSTAVIRVEPVTFHERIESNGRPIPGRRVPRPRAIDAKFPTFLKQRFEQDLAAAGFQVIQNNEAADPLSLRINLVYRPWNVLLSERMEYLVQVFHRGTLVTGYPPFTINYGWPWTLEGIATTGMVQTISRRFADILIRERRTGRPIGAERYQSPSASPTAQ